MKICKGLVVALFATSMCALPDQTEFAADTETVEGIVSALYEVISGEKGQLRDWGRFRNLFLPEGRLIGTAHQPDGSTAYRVLSPDDYIAGSGKWVEENGFFELEIHRIAQDYGSLVHVWSTYEARRSAADPAPFMRGINSIQLLHDGRRWWIVQILWLSESARNPLPEHFLPPK